MTDPVTHVLTRIVEQSATPEEMTRRVVKVFGEGTLPRARQIAAETRGLEWLRQGPKSQHVDSAPDSQRDPPTTPRAVLRRAPSLVALLIGAATLLALMLFPPFLIPLPDQMVMNAGFGFLFDPPSQGGLRAIVNTELLGTLVFGVTAATSAIYVVLRQIERSSGEERR